MRKSKTPIPSNTEGLLIGERRQRMLDLIQRNGRVLVSELSDVFGISRITIRKDLDYLESKGLLQRSHGGALPRSSVLADPPLKAKEQHQLKEKQRIAEAAVKLVEEGHCVLLDSGTTTTAIARALTAFSSLTVVTNAVNIATELAGTDFDVILTGGTLRKSSFSLAGPIAEDMLREIHADILFLGVDGFDAKAGLTTPNVLEARINRAMVHAAEKVVMVCDSTKFGRRSLSLIVPADAIHTVITDTNLSEDQAEAIKALGVEVILV
ncbi:transcriptional repressor AgaR [Granulicella mallensis]|jgi:DeoR family transcriptional regulator of aga operon|uniref:Transcriptional regulator, DeoR family n=2 Tax=Granulicella mallensis TaxID=940614 RepID=G8P1T8_GRAMM|nr:transcriptional repressor AgaR [Granulicella mallensis]AEU35913.1 transcriptional regulator, DeoR family [Granulicella mallensis MP5ACTX8]MBB5065533.1 DeoR family transcriptional regulator of aga operon [Granulicella mallensis]